MFDKLTPITRNIIIANVVVYLLANFVFQKWYFLLSAYYPFSPNFRWWQVITHMFMHAPFQGGGAGITHIIFNMFTLVSFGPVLEQVLGPKKYFWLYLLSGLGAFLIFNMWNFVEINQLATQLNAMGIDSAEIFRKAAIGFQGDYNIDVKNAQGAQLAQSLIESLQTPMMGASGAIFGIVAAFATMFPDAKLMFFFIPFPIKAKILLPIVILISVYLGFSGNMSGVAHFAHVGGAIVGFILAKIWKNNQYRIN